MTKIEQIKQQFKQLNLSTIANNLDDIVRNAQDNQVTYIHFVKLLVELEITHCTP